MLSLLAFGRGPGVVCSCRPVSLRRAVRAVVAARRRPGARLVLAPGSVLVRAGGFSLLCLSFPWSRRLEVARGAWLDFWLGRVVLPVADFVAPRWAARRWPD